jgi:dipeptidyl aminopeptidase/acylaminoacyl peptidase
MRHRSPLLFVMGLLVCAGPAIAQGTAADYERANSLRRLTANKVFKATVEPHWFDGNTRFWYRNDLAGGATEFVLVDTAKGGREPAFDHARLAAALAKDSGKPVRATHLPFTSIEFADRAETVRIRVSGKAYRWNRTTHELTEDAAKPAKPAGTEREASTRVHSENAEPDFYDRPAVEDEIDPGQPKPRSDRSPDGNWTAFIKDNNVYVRRMGGDEFALSKDGKADDSYGSPFYWSPDSRKLVVLRTKRGEERKVYIVESSPRDQLQPKLHTLTYAKPGDVMPTSKPHLFDLAAKQEIPVSDELFPNPWSISRLRWHGDSSRFTLVYNQRGHQALRVVAVDAASGKAASIVDEQSKTFIDYAHKLYLQHLEETNELIWMSERDGWNHLYLYDAKTGQVKNQITKGEWIVRAVERVDVKARQIWLRVAGIHANQDPYHIHFARINFDGSGLVVLTEGDGTHTIRYSPDERFLLATYSRVDLPPVTELRRVSDGKLVVKVEAADASAFTAAGWKLPERFVAKARDGKTDIWGVIWKPSTFDAKKSYPVIEYIYAGPQGSFVPKGFNVYHQQQAMAELGFIVVQMDGMGTSNRSKAFHDVCCKNLGDAGFPDRLLWIKAAAASRSFMDLTRVGIYGTSAGGQNSLGGMLAHPEFYKVCVSTCGCHDNRMDKVWWNELWMGYPVGPHYAAQSNVTQAKKLQGKLLLIVGEVDRNVDPASTMQVVNALIAANKDFDLLVIPSGGHGLGGAYGARRQQDFFVRHLLGVEPRR